MHRCACDWHKSRCFFDLKSLPRRAQIVKYWKQIESIRAFMRECAWRYAPASVGIMYKSGPPQFWYYNCIFANIWYLILLILSIIIILRIFMLYTTRLSRLLRSKIQRGRHKQTVYRSFHMHSGVTCTSALATGTNRAVFSTSKVCQDALFIKHKYAKDDYNWMN